MFTFLFEGLLGKRENATVSSLAVASFICRVTSLENL